MSVIDLNIVTAVYRGSTAIEAIIMGGVEIWRAPAIVPTTLPAIMSSPDPWPEPGSTVTITKGTVDGAPVGGVLALNGTAVSPTDNGATLTYVVPPGITTEQALVWTPVSGAPTSLTVYPPLSTAAVYMDHTTAPLGPVTAVTAGGTLALPFAQFGSTYSPSVMEADGLLFNGNALRWTGTLGPYSRILLVAEITLLGTPRAGAAGYLVQANASSASGLHVRHSTIPLVQAFGPSSSVLTFYSQPKNAVGRRHVIAAEISASDSALRIFESDGYDAGDGASATTAASMSPITLTRIDLGYLANAKIHRLAIYLEA